VVTCKSAVGGAQDGKFAGQRATFYHCTMRPIKCSLYFFFSSFRLLIPENTCLNCLYFWLSW